MPSRPARPPRPDLVQGKELSRVSASETLTMGELLSRGIPLPEIARLLNRTPGTIRRHCEDALTLLKASSVDAVADWRTASREAAAKGDHKPARDLLIAADVIHPVQSTGAPGLNITLGFALPGIPHPPHEHPISVNTLTPLTDYVSSPTPHSLPAPEDTGPGPADPRQPEAIVPPGEPES